MPSLIVELAALELSEINGVTKHSRTVLNDQRRCARKAPPTRDDQFHAVELEYPINPFDILEGGNGTTTYRPLNLYFVHVSR